MNGAMVLSGGGDIDQTFELDEKYFNLLGNYSKILYIPVALEINPRANETYFKWFSSLLEKHDKGKIEIDFTMITGDGVIPNLSLFDSIYFGGGNTYKLLHFVMTSGLNKKIQQYLASGGVVYGGSAGAIILGKDVRTVENENIKKSPLNNGLDLLAGKSISCHYTQSEDDKLRKLAQSLQSEIIALPEDSGLITDSTGLIIEQVGSVVNFSPNNSI